MYEVRLCKVGEVKLLRKFLRESWSPQHIFLTNDEILDFQHKSQLHYNFVVAYHKEKNEFHGVLGFISPDHYSEGLVAKGGDLWLAIWKVDKNLAENKSIGIEMLNYIKETYAPASVSAIGINKQVSLLYRLLGFKVEVMNHWFVLNNQINSFQLAVGIDFFPTVAEDLQSSYYLEKIPLKSEILSDFFVNIPDKKNAKYIRTRYGNHPSYDYSCLCLRDDKKNIVGILVGRAIQVSGSTAFRITDFWLACDSHELIGCLQEFLSENNYEYADFLEFGWDRNVLQTIGFIKADDKRFVPHLFEPFISDRREVMIAFKSEVGFVCTKGDSDLDRPNQ